MEWDGLEILAAETLRFLINRLVQLARPDVAHRSHFPEPDSIRSRWQAA